MSEKRKISVRKILQVLLTLVVTVGCVVAISGASNREIKKNITGVEINIRNDRHKFVDEQQIEEVLRANYGPDMKLVSIGKLNVGLIEKGIKENKWVANAQVYIDNQRLLHINVTQRVPVARIFEENGNTYYIDRTMSVMPVSDKYSYYTTVVTGVPHVENDSIGKSLLSQVAYMVKRIERDTFWNAQVSQISMAPDMTFEIVPVLGTQRILLGDTSDLDAKLDNLFAFYKKVMNRIGWDRYEKIDLRYKGQIVASPALQWDAPEDKLLNELKWVETIKAKEAYNKNVFSLDSNDVAVVRKQEPVIAAVSQKVPLPPSAEQVNGAAVAAKASTPAKQVPAIVKPAVKKPEQPKQVKIGPMPDVTPAKPVAKKPEAQPAPAKPAIKPTAKAEVKKANTVKPADKKPQLPKKEEQATAKAKPAEKRAETKKSSDKKVTAAKREKLPVAAARKANKKEDKKTDKRQAKEPKQTKPATKETKEQQAKYLYQSNNH